jgi:hypothetical protein
MGKHSRKYEKGGAVKKAPIKSNSAPAKPGSPAATKLGSPAAATKPGSPAAAKPGSPAPTKPGSPAATKPDSPPVAKPGSPAAAKPGSPAAAKPGSPVPAKPVANAADKQTVVAPPSPPPVQQLPDVDFFGNPPLPDDSQKKGRIMDVFVLLYNILGVIGAAVLIGLFILNLYDVVKILIKEASQALAIYLNPNLYNKDTIDVQILAYHKEDSKEEPFTIFLQQQILKFIFNYGSGFIILLAAQLCILLLITVYFRLITKKEHNETISLTILKKPLIIIGLTMLSGFILNYYYESQFKKKVQVDIVNSQKVINEMKILIYNNLTTNQGFINAMLNKNITECENIMNAQRGSDKIQAVSRMIFTSSVYNFYRNLISEEKEEYYTVVQKMFTGDQSIFPTDYMFYKQNVFFADDYANIKDKIFGEDKALSTLEEEQLLHEDITQRTHNVNRLLTNLYKLPERVNQVRNYLFISLFLISMIIGVMVVLYMREFKMIYNMFLRGVCNRISQYFIKRDFCPLLFIEPEQVAQQVAEEKKGNKGFFANVLDALKPTPTGNQPTQPSPQNTAAIAEAKEKLDEAKQKEEALKQSDQAVKNSDQKSIQTLPINIPSDGVMNSEQIDNFIQTSGIIKDGKIDLTKLPDKDLLPDSVRKAIDPETGLINPNQLPFVTRQLSNFLIDKKTGKINMNRIPNFAKKMIPPEVQTQLSNTQIAKVQDKTPSITDTKSPAKVEAPSKVETPAPAKPALPAPAKPALPAPKPKQPVGIPALPPKPSKSSSNKSSSTKKKKK